MNGLLAIGLATGLMSANGVWQIDVECPRDYMVSAGSNPALVRISVLVRASKVSNQLVDGGLAKASSQERMARGLGRSANASGTTSLECPSRLNLVADRPSLRAQNQEQHVGTNARRSTSKSAGCQFESGRTVAQSPAVAQSGRAAVVGLPTTCRFDVPRKNLTK